MDMVFLSRDLHDHASLDPRLSHVRVEGVVKPKVSDPGLPATLHERGSDTPYRLPLVGEDEMVADVSHPGKTGQHLLQDPIYEVMGLLGIPGLGEKTRSHQSGSASHQRTQREEVQDQ
jgi:hypothetical protein